MPRKKKGLMTKKIEYREGLLSTSLALLRSFQKTHVRCSASAGDGGDGGIRTRDTPLRVCQFSKLVVSATHPRHRVT